MHHRGRTGAILHLVPFVISFGNDLHHVLTQTGAYMKDVTATAKEKSKQWQPRASALL